MAEVKIPSQSGEMPGWLAIPQSTRPWPGVVLYDAAGMSLDLTNEADWLSGEGYLAIAPDLYYPGGKIARIRAMIRDAAARQSKFFEDIEAARAWLARRDAGQAKSVSLASVWEVILLCCWLRGMDIPHPAVNYGGQLPSDAEKMLAGACLIVDSYGAKDRWNRGVATELERVLTRARIDHDVKEYPDAGHSFLNDHKNAVFKMMKIMGVDYHGPFGAGCPPPYRGFF